MSYKSNRLLFIFYNRQWIGIDQSDEAIKAIKIKLDSVKGDLFVSKSDYKLLVEKEVKINNEFVEIDSEIQGLVVAADTTYKLEECPLVL